MSAPTPSSGSPTTAITLDRRISTTINALLDSNVGEGMKWGEGGIGTAATVYYSFPGSTDQSLWFSSYTSDTQSEIYSRFSALSTFQQAQATAALQSWANVANIDIQYVAFESAAAVGDIRVALTSGGEMNTETAAYAYFPNTTYGGDVWINADQNASGGDYNTGGFSYHVLLHELGHALGLSHPFEGTLKLASKFENYQYTVMSYSDAPKHEDTGGASLYPTTPMLFDVQAIQYLYGANMQYHTGDDVYVFDGNATYYQTIWDAGGNDTIQLNSTQGGVINLNAGTYSKMGLGVSLSNGKVLYETIAIAYNVTIENVIGGQGNDIIYGNAAANHLDGAAGTDTLIGGKGDDVYTVDFLVSGSKIILQDKITEAGNAGLDTIVLRGNADTSASFSAIKLAANIENFDISQTNAANINLIGDKKANVLTGNAGDNMLDGGTGADQLFGGQGNDTYVLDQAGDIVTEALNEGTDTVILKFANAGVYTLADTLENATLSGSKSFNILGGNALDNVLTGNSKSNTIYGGFGDDIINGSAGNDKLYGDDGNDTLTGGAGSDVFIWDWDSTPNSGNRSDDTVTDFSMKQKDVLNIKDLLGGESKSDINSLLNFIDITVDANKTEFHISALGTFNNGAYDAAKEDTRIVLQNMNLLGASSEYDVLAMLVSKNLLIVD